MFQLSWTTVTCNCNLWALEEVEPSIIISVVFLLSTEEKIIIASFRVSKEGEISITGERLVKAGEKLVFLSFFVVSATKESCGKIVAVVAEETLILSGTFQELSLLWRTEQ